MTGPNGHPDVTGDISKNFVAPGEDFINNMNLAQLQAFYQNFVNQLSAVCTLAAALPLAEMIRANERLRTSGALVVPSNVPPEQVQQWLRNLENDHNLLTNFVNTLAPLRR